MIIALAIVLTLAYLFIGGFVGRRFYDGRLVRCAACSRIEQRRKDGHEPEPFYHCYSTHEFPAAMVGCLWPIALPMVAGDFFAQRAEGRIDRDERRHQQHVKELEARESLAREQKEKTLADIQFLVENGIEADVPGLYER